MDLEQEAETVMKKSYRDKALDTFVRGLRGDMSRLLSMKEPVDLPNALHLCLKLENQNFRAFHANSKSFRTENRIYNLNQRPLPGPKPTFSHHGQ